jgi:polar amino acid transport system permease protein
VDEFMTDYSASPIRKRTFWQRFKKSPIIDIIKFLLVISAVVWLLARGTENLGYNWQWYQVPQYIYLVEDGELFAGPLMLGLVVTLEITFYGLILSMIIGLVTALLRLSDSFFARLLARGYLELIRNTPLLIQIFFLYFVLAPIFDLNRVFAGILALSLFEGAYASEIFRAGILSIQKGQWEASHSLGLSTANTYGHIILPQAIRRILPPLTSQAISLVKDSALVSTIAVYDLTMEGRAIISFTFLTFEIWFTIAAIYLVVTLFLSIVVKYLENRFKIMT